MSRLVKIAHEHDGAGCEARDRIRHIHYLGLHCAPEALAARLRARGDFFATEEFIAMH